MTAQLGTAGLVYHEGAGGCIMAKLIESSRVHCRGWIQESEMDERVSVVSIHEEVPSSWRAKQVIALYILSASRTAFHLTCLSYPQHMYIRLTIPSSILELSGEIDYASERRVFIGTGWINETCTAIVPTAACSMSRRYRACHRQPSSR